MQLAQRADCIPLVVRFCRFLHSNPTVSFRPEGRTRNFGGRRFAACRKGHASQSPHRTEGRHWRWKGLAASLWASRPEAWQIAVAGERSSALSSCSCLTEIAGQVILSTGLQSTDHPVEIGPLPGLQKALGSFSDDSRPPGSERQFGGVPIRSEKVGYQLVSDVLSAIRFVEYPLSCQRSSG